MKKPVLFLTAFCFCIAASAQKVYYIYFQSENQSPFFVKMSDKLYSSASSGFLVISNLPDSIYNFTVGFPSSSTPELKYTLATNGNDKGLLLKNSESGVALIDLKDQSIIKPNVDSSKPVAYETKTDKFSTLLSKAADDPNLLKVPIQVKEEVKSEEQKDLAKDDRKSEIKSDTTAVQPTETNVSENSKDVAKDSKKKKKEKKLKDVVADDKKTNEQKPVDTKQTDVVKTDDQKQADFTKTDDKKGDAQKTDDNKTSEVTPKDVNVDASTQTNYIRTVVSRHSETSTSEGFGLTYFDVGTGTVDTIRLIIPNPKKAPKHKDEEVKVPDQQKEVTNKVEDPKPEIKMDTTTVVQNPETNIPNDSKDVAKDTKKKKKEKKQPDVVVPDDNKPQEQKPIETKTEEKKDIVQQETQKNNTDVPVTQQAATNINVPVNTNCSAQASDKDFFKLRKTMAGKETDESMVEEAKKSFKKQCFTTEQIRYLGSLFLTSAGKYLFFDAAFSHASDPENYKTLQTEIKDQYYLKRFKALVGE